MKRNRTRPGSLTAPAGTYQYKTGTITWTGPLTANALFTITYGAQLDAATVGGTAITNRALFQGAGTIASMSSVIHARWETALPLVQHNFCSDFIDDFSSPRGWPVGGWYPEQRMTRDEALKSMSLWAASV